MIPKFSIWQSPNPLKDLNPYFADVMEAFKMAKEVLPLPNSAIVMANAGAYTDALVTVGYKSVHENVLNIWTSSTY